MTDIAVSHYDVKQAKRRPDVNFPDLTRIADIVINTLYKKLHGEELEKVLADELLNEWVTLTNEAYEKLEGYAQDNDAFLGSDPVHVETPRKAVELDVYWDHPIVWKAIRMLTVLDQQIAALNDARKSNFLSETEYKKRQKFIAKPLRRVLTEILDGSKSLFVRSGGGERVSNHP